MILSSLSNVTTSATQLGAHEWFTYLKRERERRGSKRALLRCAAIGVRRHSPSRPTGQSGVDHLLVVDAKHVDPAVLEDQRDHVSAQSNIYNASLSLLDQIFWRLMKCIAICIKDNGHLRLVDLLTAIGHLVAYDGANVLDDHGVLLQVFSSI